MGQTDEIMMRSRPSGFVYTPITRGHKPTPSQESNTLSEMSTTTTVSMDSAGPISPKTYEEDDESRLEDFNGRLEDFNDEELAGSRDDLSLAGSEHNSTLKDSAHLDSSQAELRFVQPNLEHCSSNLGERSHTFSARGSNTRDSIVSGLSDARFRDSCDTVVRVCVDQCSGDGCNKQGCVTKVVSDSSDLIPGMPRETKSANSDYGSFCATPVGGGEVASIGPPRSGGVSTSPYQRAENSTHDQSDNSIIAGDSYQRAPLLTDSETEEDAHGAGKGPTRPPDRSAPVKLVIPVTPARRDNTEQIIPGEPLKTLLSALFLGSGFVATTTSLAVTHERVPEIDPLPDILLDNVSYMQWGLDVSEILIMISTFTAFLVVMLHSHRSIVLRRVWFLLGCLYYYRAITMFITVLPKADPSYTCNPKLNNTTDLPALVIVKRVLILMSGMGLSINGKHIYCGDYIFSGHTMVLTMGYLVIREYSPRRFFVLHWISFLTSLTGIIMLLIARGHYSIDCLLAYYVTTRMWWIYHTLAHNNNLKTRGNHNFLDQMWWWLIFRYFEINIEGPLPRKYGLPLPRRVKKYFKALFRRRSPEAAAVQP